MANKDRTCVVCGKAYKFCNNCPEFSTMEAWHNLYDTDVCRVIFNVASRFASGKLPAADARRMLAGVDIPTTLSGGVKKNIEEILAATTVPVEDKKDETEEDTVVEKPVKIRNRQNKIVNQINEE